MKIIIMYKTSQGNVQFYANWSPPDHNFDSPLQSQPTNQRTTHKTCKFNMDKT